MSRIGYYYRPDSQHYRAKDLERWLPVMLDMGAGWTVLRASLEKRVPDFFIRTLIDHGMQPIVHIPEPAEPINVRAISGDLQAYAELGVKYVVIFDQLNMRSAWSGQGWSAPGLTERAAQKITPILEAQFEAGLVPVYPPLHPGGDYWDLAFLKDVLGTIKRTASSNLIESLAIACYGWDFGRGPRFGAGGPNAWSEARPYSASAGSENQQGARAFEWYAATAREVLGVRPKTLVIAGGTGPTAAQRQDPRVTAETHARIIEDIAQEGPDWLACFCFYTLTAGEDQTQRVFALHQADQPAPGQAMAEVKSISPHAAGSDKSLRHYLLLPPGQVADREAWANAMGYVQAFQPAVGFSVSEAALAKRVTLAGGEDVFPMDVEEQLRNSGAIVERLTLRSSFSDDQIAGHAKRAVPISGACHESD